MHSQRMATSLPLLSRFCGELLPATSTDDFVSIVSSLRARMHHPGRHPCSSLGTSGTSMLSPGRPCSTSTPSLDLPAAKMLGALCSQIPWVESTLKSRPFLPSSTNTNWLGVPAAAAAFAGSLVINEDEGTPLLFRSTVDREDDEVLDVDGYGAFYIGSAIAPPPPPPPVMEDDAEVFYLQSPIDPPPPPGGSSDDDKLMLLKLLLQLQNNLSRLLQGKEYQEVTIDLNKKNEKVVIVVSDIQDTRLIVEALLEEMKTSHNNNLVFTLVQKLSFDLARLEKLLLAEKEVKKSWSIRQLEDLIGPLSTRILSNCLFVIKQTYHFCKGKLVFLLALSACISANLSPAEGYRILVMLFEDAKQSQDNIVLELQKKARILIEEENKAKVQQAAAKVELAKAEAEFDQASTQGSKRQQEEAASKWKLALAKELEAEFASAVLAELAKELEAEVSKLHGAAELAKALQAARSEDGPPQV